MREVSLSKKAVNIIDSFTELNKYLNTDYLFTTSKGTPFQLNAINTYLRKLSKQLEIDKPLSSHIFRHTHISKLAEIGSPLYAIQDRVGHENSKITESIYLHVIKGVKEKLNRDIELL
ncbi:tyrosine-type recombinase/integrase [Carnobacterium maltaromaticum]|uniref:tyrosine-type recombinase/integrase n=1 Tax=Carnobacterium maltaromaticum TaxID=2751 RepID=UPI0039BDBDE0